MRNKTSKNYIFSNIVVRRFLLPSFLLLSLVLASTISYAQTVEQVRWKSESQVREILGEPVSTTTPVGTHATYTMWKYDNFTVAFANSRAFHLFNANSLRKVELNDANESPK